MTPQARIQAAVELLYEYGLVDGAHHKQWLLDQIVRVLADTPEDYKIFVDEFDGQWDEGIAP